jgi:hypothetical protein
MKIQDLFEKEEKQIKKLADTLLIAKELIKVINDYIVGFRIKDIEFYDEKKRRKFQIIGEFANKESCTQTKKDLNQLIHQMEINTHLKIGYRSEIPEPKYGNIFTWNILVWEKRHEAH